MNESVLQKMLTIAEEFFGTENDPNQMPITIESFYKLQTLHPDTILYKTKNNDPISWVVILPTQKVLMEKFLNEDINEKELLTMTKKQDTYDTLYLCSAFTIPEYRKQGLALQIMKEAITKIPYKKENQLFTWIYSQEWEKLINTLEKDMNIKIIKKK